MQPSSTGTHRGDSTAFTGLVNPQFSFIAVEDFSPLVVGSLSSLDGFDAHPSQSDLLSQSRSVTPTPIWKDVVLHMQISSVEDSDGAQREPIGCETSFRCHSCCAQGSWTGSHRRTKLAVGPAGAHQRIIVT